MSFLTWNLVSFGAIILAIITLTAVRKLGFGETLRKNHSVTDPMMNIVGMLFAILLGFLVANAMTRFEEARLTVEQENGACGNVFRLARALPEPTRSRLMRQCSDYIHVVVDEEWPLMEKGQTSPRAWAIYDDIWQAVDKFEPTGQRESNIHQVLVGSMTQFGECRRARAVQMQTSLPNMLWYLLFAGAALTVGFSFFFSLRSLRLQLLMTAIMTYVLFMNLFLLISFNEPFTGDVKIGHAAFDNNYKMFPLILAGKRH